MLQGILLLPCFMRLSLNPTLEDAFISLLLYQVLFDLSIATTISLIANFAKLSKSEQDMILTKVPDDTGYGYSNAMRHLYHFIRQEKPYFEELINVEDLFRVLIVEPQQFSERIRVQSGAFLLSAFHERFERDEILSFNPQTPIYYHYKPTISWNHKKSILRELHLLNISSETLYPGLDESARAITDTYRQRLSQG